MESGRESARLNDPLFRRELRARLHSAWNELACLCTADLRRLAHVLGLSEADAMDAAQTACVIALRIAARYDTERHPYRWLAGICGNVCKRMLRSRRAHREVEWPAGDIGAAARPSGIDAEDAAAVREAVQRLGELDRVIVVLHYFEGLSIDEVAQALGIRRVTADKRLSRARHHLRLFLPKRFGDSVP